MRFVLALALLVSIIGCDTSTPVVETLAPITLDLSGIVKTADGSALPSGYVRLEGRRLSSPNEEPALLKRAPVKDDGHFSFTSTFPLLRVHDDGTCIARARTGEIQVVLVAVGPSGQWTAAMPACTERPQTVTLVVP